jgi:hypothetical protein
VRDEEAEMTRARSWVLAAALVGGALALPAGAQDAELLDYEAVRAAMPKMRELSDKGFAFGEKLHVVMDAMDATQDESKLRELRAELRTLLTEYRALKLEQTGVIRPLLRLTTTSMTDEEILRKLRDTDLTSIVWEDANFDKCVRDLSRALEIPIRLQHRVVQKNAVSLRFQKAPAEMILATLCNGFDLRYVIHAGEIIIYKKITPTEERFLDYQKRHPEVKLKYWQKEDASGHVDTSKGGGK